MVAEAAEAGDESSADYVCEGKILGQYIKQHFAGKKIGYFNR